MRVEIDQSGKFEQLNTYTVIACANGKEQAIFLSASVKRRLVQKLRKTLVPRKDIIAVVFGVLVFILLEKLDNFPDVIVIDEEYTGKEAIIRETLRKLILYKTKDKWKGSVRFKRVGKSSPAHRLAWKLYRAKKGINTKRISEKEVLRWWL